MNDLELKKEIQQRTEEIEKVLHSYLPKAEGYQKIIMEAMSFMVRMKA